MTRDDRTWFQRTFDSGRDVDPPQDPPDADGDAPIKAETGGINDTHRTEEIRLAAKAEALTAAVCVAKGYEQRGANAAAVRIALAYRADEAWQRLDAHHHSPLGEAAGPPALLSPAASPSGEPSERFVQPDRREGAPGLGLTANETEPSPLDPNEARIRLELIPDAIETAVEMLDVIAKSAPHLTGAEIANATTSTVEYLRTMQTFARGQSRVTLAPVPEPQSLRVGPPTLRIVS